MTVPPAVWALLALVGFAVFFLVSQRRQQTRRLAEMRDAWGSPRDRQRNMAHIRRYLNARLAAEATGEPLDDRTWADLNMDDVFAVLDRAESTVGQQVLYARLRSATGGHLDAFEHLVTRMQADLVAREHAQRALVRVSDPAGYGLVDLTSPGWLETRPWHVLFPILGVTMAIAVVAIPFWPVAVLLLAAGSVASLIVRATVAHDLRLVAGAFRQVGPLLGAAEDLQRFSTPEAAPILGRLREDTLTLTRLRRIAGWAGRDSSSAVSGDISSLFFEYLNLVFCLDANALFFGGRELRAHGAPLSRVITAVGEVDAALSVASYRAGTPGWTRPVMDDPSAPLQLAGIRHPLVSGAVPNSITLRPPSGIVITGSNMSGKSTFLRTVGVTVVMAQTINTCVAASYRGPVFVVRSCIGRADDLLSGKSYYQAEVESVLSLVTSAASPIPQLLLFDELFRGTNAVERIAGAEAVLVELLAAHGDPHTSPHVVLVATHDRELVDLLQGVYAAYHFTDTIDEHGLSFDYQLLPGAATTRNAIALLRLRGAPSSLVERALARAKMLDERPT